MRGIDLSGQKFGRLTVIGRNGTNVWKEKMWLCKCDCGNDITVVSSYLRRGDTRSCGCLLMDELKGRTKLTDLQRKANLNAIKRKSLLSKYGISTEEYNTLFHRQNGCCAICGKHQKELTTSLCVDHNHITGKVRGLLCRKCNAGLGLLEDDTNLVKKALSFLEETDGWRN